MACPICKSHQFYIKDPADEFEIHEFEWRDGRLQPVSQDTGDGSAKIETGQEVFCQSCAWHGKETALK